MRIRNFSLLFCILVVIFISLSLLSLSLGSSGFSPHIILQAFSDEAGSSGLIFWHIRLPRLVVAILVGSSLALAGVAMQALFANPLADPSITGVSSGSALGAVLALLLFSTPNAIQFGAIVCGLFTAFLVFNLGRSKENISALSILLAGIAVNAFCGAIVGFCMYSIKESGLKNFVFWSLGSLEIGDWNAIALSACIAIPSWFFIFRKASALNLMLLGVPQAFHSGVNIKKLWISVTIAAALMSASSVAISGLIGFVGLVVPHILRLLCSTSDNKILMPLSAISGAILIIFSDIISRFISPLEPVPIGVITALLGAPFFIYLLKRKDFL